MIRFERLLSTLDPLTQVQRDESLPPDSSCASISEVFASVESRIGPALLDTPGRAALHRVASRIPAQLATFWGLEMRLGDPAARADLLWEVAQRTGGIPTLAGRNPHDCTPELTAALRDRSPFWRKLGRFAEEWLDSADWRRRLGNIWLEADTAAASRYEALDARLDRPSLFWGWNRNQRGSDRELLACLPEFARRFYGAELDRAWFGELAGTIPEQAVVFQMGFMGARAQPGIRLCVNKLDPGAQRRWLAEIGWPGDFERLRETLSRLAMASGELALNVDVLQGGVGPKLGIEVYSSERTLDMETWQPLFNGLLKLGLAREDKIEALASYPSYRRFRQNGAWRRNPPIGNPVMATNLHHLKLVVAEGAITEVKAYLSIFRPVMNYSRSRGRGADEEFSGWR